MVIIKRPVLITVIGYIIGLIWGLYLSKLSIGPFYLLIIVIFLIYKKINNGKEYKFKLISFHRYKRYIKIWITKGTVILFIISSIIGNCIIDLKENEYNYIQKKMSGKTEYIGIIKTNKIEKDYYDLYKIEIENKDFYLKVKNKIEYNVGDKVKIQGEYEEPEIQRNYKGFDYSKYLKSKKIYGTVNASKIEMIGSKKDYVSDISMLIRNKAKYVLKDESYNFFIAFTLGDTTRIDSQIKDEISQASISHILAISGMHISYILLGIESITKRIFGKRKSYFICLFFLVFYLFFVIRTGSVLRAVIMNMLVIGSKLLYKKNDIYNNFAISALIISMINPYIVLDIGFKLSYLGAIGIVVFSNSIKELIKMFKIKNKKYKYRINRKFLKIYKKFIEIISVIIAAQIITIPIIVMEYNSISIYSVISNLILSIIIGPVIAIAMLITVSIFVNKYIAIVFANIFDIGVSIILSLANKISGLPFSKLYIATPSIIVIILMYIGIFLSNYLIRIYLSKNLCYTQIRIKNLVALAKYRYRNTKIKKYITSLLIITLIFCDLVIKINNNYLQIYFIDVGQGDSCLIITPKQKKILIDGGGSEFGTFNVGKSTLLPYLLDRKITYLDMVFISHFDSDHVGGILYLMENIKIKQIYITKQQEESENYKDFLKIKERKKIKVKVIERGEKIKIENNLNIDIIWPQNQLISSNPLNNNSLVVKINYNRFSCLFTGDIEETAEEEILKTIENNELKSIIIKIAHHGSKTSSIEKFLDEVNPKIALIGVGKNNNFGHPSQSTIENLTKRNIKIYRTDKNGEICLKIDEKGNIKIKTCIKKQ